MTDTPSQAPADGAAENWSPAKPREDGVFVHADDLPINHRLRAEALVAAGAGEDPEGLIGSELIANTKARLEAEAEAAVALEKPLVEQTALQLRATASREGVALPSKAPRPDMIAAIEAARAATAAAAANSEGTDQ